MIKEKDGRSNRYRIQAHHPLPEPAGQERTVGEIPALLSGTDATATRDRDVPELGGFSAGQIS